MRMSRTLALSIAIVAAGITACSDEAAPPLPTATSEPTDESTSSATAGSVDSSTSVSTLPPTTTTTLPPLVTEGAVVLVANAADVPGSAGRLTQALEGVGFATNPPTDAAGWEIRLDTSKVYYLKGSQKAARSIARRMGVDVYPMPVPVPISGAYEFFGDTTVLIMLGRDLADQPIPGITP